MAPNLKRRLARLKEAADRSTGRPLPQQSSAASDDRAKPKFLLEGWLEGPEFVWRRRIVMAAPCAESLEPGAFAPLRARRAASPAPWASSSPRVRVAAEELRYFDLETTGLSGGSGTLAFLAAIGRSVGEGALELAQVFLADYPGEGGFIDQVLELLGSTTTIVSYNGRAFDLPLLGARCILNGRRPPANAHIDALYAARRLWGRSLGGASLELLEAELLGQPRQNDIPGALIPEVWLDFVRSGEGGDDLGRVVSHNAQDIAALAQLAAEIQEACDNPPGRARRRPDEARLARTLLSLGRDKEAESLLARAARRGEAEALLLLLRRLRRERRIKEAQKLEAACLRCLSKIGAAGFETGSDSEQAPLGEGESAIDVRALALVAREMALLFERGSGDLRAAERWAEVELRLTGEGSRRVAAERRLARIRRRAAGGAA